MSIDSPFVQKGVNSLRQLDRPLAEGRQPLDDSLGGAEVLGVEGMRPPRVGGPSLLPLLSRRPWPPIFTLPEILTPLQPFCVPRLVRLTQRGHGSEINVS